MQISDIKQQVKEVIEYSQGINDPKVDELIDTWFDAKRDIMEILGNEPIYEFPQEVSFDLNQTEKLRKIDDLAEKIEYRWLKSDLASFILDNKDTFFNNLVSKEYFMKDGTIIPKGMKLVKAFKYFEKNKDVLYDLQNLASRVIQEDKLTGHLCISVHPLDFLSASENCHNWRSCHALDGEFRAGALSYMTDKATFMVYLKSDDDEILPNFPPTLKWNSKKWRMWVYLSDMWDMAFAGRQYPFTSDTVLDMVRNEVLSKFCGKDRWTEWSNYAVSTYEDPADKNMHLHYRYLPINFELIRADELIVDQSNLHYDDLLNSSCYVPYYTFREPNRYRFYLSDRGSVNTRFHLGGEVKCLQCGKELIEIPETMRCNRCETLYGTLDTDEFGYCSCCGRHISYDCATWVNDEPICEQCARTEVSLCDRCGEVFFNEDVQFHERTGQMLCKYCMEDLMSEEEKENS